MLRNLLFTFGMMLTTSLLVFSQSGTLKGTIKDKDTGEPIPYANIIVELGGTQVGGTSSDFDGNYMIKPITPGKYDLRATFIGFKTQLVEGIIISSDKITFYDLKLVPTTQTLIEVEIVAYKVPLISKDQTTSGQTVTAEEIEKMPNRSADGVAATVGGVFSRDGERGSVRGARADGTVTYIDGIKVTGSASLPPSAIEQVSVLLGGLPAQYGDATGGVINVTTKGPSREFGAGIEIESSQFLDNFGYNRMGFNLNGPLFTRKDENGNVSQSLFGYFIAGNLTFREDGSPTSTGIYTVKSDVLNQLKNDPIRISALSGGIVQNAGLLRLEDLDHLDASQNTARYGVNVSAKFDVKTTKTINLTFGGQFVQNEGNFNNGSLAGVQLMNYEKNTHYKNSTYRVFGRFTQRFPTDKENPGLFQNIYYSIQADYSKYHAIREDPDHKDDLFKYGYIGKFEEYTQASYELGNDTINGQAYSNVYLLNGWEDGITVDFTPSTYNPLIAQWTTEYYDLYADQPFMFRNRTTIQGNGGLYNGDAPDNVYSLFQSAGAIQSGYFEQDNSQIGINVAASADIGNHAIKIGFQYEQRSESYVNYAATSFWDLMRGLTNFHIQQLDFESPDLVYRDGIFQDTIRYPRLYDENSQRWFDINLRNALGLDVEGLDYIVTDSYDFENRSFSYYDKAGTLHKAYLEQDLGVDLFSPDELLNDGTYRALWQGYDYKGNKLTSKPSFEDFFTETDDNGMFTRPIGAFEPIYMAGYIQDKFAFNDLIFNVGVRVDRFDANQMTLKDPFLIYPAYTIGELSAEDIVSLGVPEIPGNVGDDYVVYVNDVHNPTEIVGFRDGDVWYNSKGVEINDLSILDAGSGVSPYLVDPTQNRTSIESFEDYEPQWSVMPRISFSFPISDEALFFAHYDVLTQRPTSNITVNPATYYFFNEISGSINNPNLKPSKTIDYELGFQQKLSNSSSLKLTAFYREMTDMVQAFRFSGAFPRDYTSFTNLDFGTVKGLTVTYDLRRTNNARVRAEYTLQFADATGASPTTAAALIAAGQPNLRATFPMPWDRRHQINLLIDYRYSDGADYDGPVIGDKQILKNAGISLTFNGGSGTPYTASRSINSPITGGTDLLKGTYSGSRLPWQFKMDLRIDKDFDIKFKENSKGKTNFNVYLQVLNVLNTKNVVGVYPFTGNADDDGYLAAAEYQKEINSQLDPESFRQLYGIYVDSPGNYSSPRFIRLGLICNF
jgi:outer membrane receptor protein involved in Fe transport